ncbi:STAS/SEC14 domain-containing protein [bacterium]|nr:STAS/SEC14 domain-containing protein [bacterium]
MNINLQETTMAKEKFKLWYDEKEGVLRGEIYERFDVESLERFYNEATKYTPEQQHYVVGWLYDEAQKMVGKEERKIAKEKGDLVHFKKMALLGAKPVIRMVAQIVMSAQGRGKDFKFFDSEEEALAWIREQKALDKKALATQR